MFTQIRGPEQYFMGYLEDNALLIQFILIEFVQTYRLTFQIKPLIQEVLESTKPPENHLKSLIQIFGQLVGSLPQQERSSFSRWTKGSLSKLKDYSEQFSRNSHYKNKNHINLHMTAHHFWMTAIHHVELLHSIHSNPPTQKGEANLLLHSLKKIFQTLQTRVNQLIRQIPRVMNEFADNENVILCLFRIKPQLNDIYGSDLFKLFKWSKSKDELIQFMIERFKERGFETLIPTIHQVIEAQVCRT